MDPSQKIGRRQFLAGIAMGTAGLAALSTLGRFSFRHSNKNLRRHIEQLQRDRKTVPPLPGLFDLKGVIHVHTFLSPDSQGTPERILRAAREGGLHFLVTTDHNNRKLFTEGIQGQFADLVVIRGVEMIKEGQTLLAINTKEYINGHRMSIQEAVKEIKSQGGLAFVAHPLWFKEWHVEGIDGMEIYDIADAAYAQFWKAPWVALDVLTSWKDYPEEVLLSLLSRPDHHLSKWDRLVNQRRLVGIAGNDAHENVNFLGRQVDAYPLDFRFVQTHLLTTTREERSLLESLRAGHAYLSFSLLADATGFQFFAEKSRILGIMGDELPYTSRLVLAIQAPQTGLIRLYRDGEVVDKAISGRLQHSVTEKGIYRVEVSLPIGRDQYPWIFSNPIYVV